MTRALRRLAVVALARAVRPCVDGEHGPTRTALDLARNAVGALTLDPELDVRALLADMLHHRLAHAMLRCGDVDMAAELGAAAWRRVGPPREGRAAA